jgi:hypothetical protein
MVASRSEAPAPGALPPAAQRRQSAPAAGGLAGKQQQQQQAAAGVWVHGGGSVEVAAAASGEDQTALLQVGILSLLAFMRARTPLLCTDIDHCTIVTVPIWCLLRRTRLRGCWTGGPAGCRRRSWRPCSPVPTPPRGCRPPCRSAEHCTSASLAQPMRAADPRRCIIHARPGCACSLHEACAGARGPRRLLIAQLILTKTIFRRGSWMS